MTALETAGVDPSSILEQVQSLAWLLESSLVVGPQAQDGAIRVMLRRT
jgi:hypothetical protein